MPICSLPEFSLALVAGLVSSRVVYSRPALSASFEIIDADDSGALHIAELVHGLLKVRGEVKSLARNSRHVARTSIHVERLDEAARSLQGKATLWLRYLQPNLCRRWYTFLGPRGNMLLQCSSVVSAQET